MKKIQKLIEKLKNYTDLDDGLFCGYRIRILRHFDDIVLQISKRHLTIEVDYDDDWSFLLKEEKEFLSNFIDILEQYEKNTNKQ